MVNVYRWRAALAAAGLLVLAGCGSAVGNALGLSSGPSWTITSQTDPMSDEVVHQATATFKADRTTIQAQVSCSTRQTDYVFTTFDANGQPAPLELNYDHARVDYRLDDQPAMQLTLLPAATNQVRFNDDQGVLAAASVMTLRFYMTGYQDTIRIEQGKGRFHDMLTQCAQAQKVAHDRSAALGRQQNKAEQRCKDAMLADARNIVGSTSSSNYQACRDLSEPQDQPQAASAASPNATDRPPPPAATAASDVIPPQFRGRWSTKNGCPETERMEVFADHVDLYDSHGSVERVTTVDEDKEYLAKITYEGEGDIWTDLTDFKRSGPDLITAEKAEGKDDSPIDWVPCR